MEWSVAVCGLGRDFWRVFEPNEVVRALRLWKKARRIHAKKTADRS